MSDLFDVSQETILVTGASQGLGRQFARVLAGDGAAVVLAARQIEKLRSLEAEIKAKGGRAAAVQMDVTDTAGIARALDAAEAALGPITVLINNAGIAIEKLSTEQTEADWDAVINANLKGAYFLATEMARRMIARKQARQYRQYRLRARPERDEIPVALHDLQGGYHPGHQGDGPGACGQQHPRQRAGAGLYRHRDEP